MNDPRLHSMAEKLAQGLLDYGPGLSRLLLRIMRRLAQGRPVAREEVSRLIAELGLVEDEAQRFLQKIAERDAEGQILGIMGLSLNDSTHRLHLGKVTLSAWCAEDTLFLPAMLGQTATIESRSPLSNQTIRLTVSPERVETVSPAGAVLSIVVVDPTEESMASVQSIWTTFCNHIHFFPSRAEADQWAAGKANIAVIDVEEGFEFGRQVWSRVLPYAEHETSRAA